MGKLKKAAVNLLTDPLHAIVGLDLVATGLILLTHHRYFFWPPWPAWITAIENDPIVGFIGICTGAGMIWWSLANDKSIRANRMLIPTASAYYALLSMTELMHGLFVPAGTPHMYMSGLSEFIMLLITLYMAKSSPTRRSSTND
ncbi:hypothetical protein lacNasYZ03_08190 [Lactobacillus nasalidis]|uniref:Uncharacterized protein n=1 Tax=Lactobacillus nasalidis TaxID=2797258 RepID=A0ABQ3WAB5_9LACO|nr:hypothetical protein [Lactobacillus nasalidis]GHV97316.1 hypothetical protein lacNasYZ01_04980 [Lactobacillus nasalidis]GHV99912.1 hypothetical protein lacNasYZ02_13420 [Lactobacillus nasalidis]GHW01132.1 hypothetical protein lacNasYZ03_08190 [Lactobacillus nasalidis]